jgi:hypothetical protein
MTIRNIFRSAAAILISSLITSCIETDKTTGSGLVPDNHILKVKTAIFDLPVQMKMSDSLQTIFSGSLVVGAYKDPDLGLVEASTAFQMIPAADSLSFGTNPVAKSFKMYVNVADKSFFYEKDQYVPQNFHVYTLTRDLDSSVAYNNSLTDSDYNPVKINLGGSIFFGGDSLVMDLSLAYAQQLLSATTAESDSTEIFLKRFKGLYMKTDPLPGSLEGGRFNIIDPLDIFFTLEYRHIDAANNIDKDSLIYYFVSDVRPTLNRFKHSSQSLQSTNPQQKIYVEGLAGIKPYIDFNDVKTQMTSWAQANNTDISKLIIAKAELRFPYEFPQDFTRMTYYPSQLFLFTREKGGTTTTPTVMYEPVDDISYYESNGSINRSLLYYSLDISTYLQKIVQNKITGKSMQTWVAPILQQSDPYSGTVYYYIQNILYGKAILNGKGMTRKPVLVLTYAVMP